MKKVGDEIRLLNDVNEDDLERKASSFGMSGFVIGLVFVIKS